MSATKTQRATSIKELAERAGLSAEDLQFQLAKEDVRVTPTGVRYWFTGTVPDLIYVIPLAKILGVSNTTVLEAMHEMRLVQTAAKIHAEAAD